MITFNSPCCPLDLQDHLQGVLCHFLLSNNNDGLALAVALMVFMPFPALVPHQSPCMTRK